MSTSPEPVFTLLQDAAVYTPEPIGRKSVLLFGDRIAHVGDVHGLRGLPGVRLERLRNRILTPGLFDQHLHIAGAGGEGGFAFRTPPVAVDDLLEAGITGAVGLLGTDGVTRSAIELLAEVRRLQAHGFSTFMYSGAYWVPTRTITDSLRMDLVTVPEVLGAGEIAVSDRRGAEPPPRLLASLAREVYVGALLAGKAGVLHLHLGDETSGLAPLFDTWRASGLPIRVFRPTHLNRTPALLEESLQFAAAGGLLDVTAGISPTELDREPLPPAAALSYLRNAGVPLAQLTLSSDGNGSSPRFSTDGRLQATQVIRPAVLLETVRELAHHWPLAEALAPATRTPAEALGLDELGTIRKGAKAHLLIFNEALELEALYLAGTLRQPGGASSRPYGLGQSRAARYSATSATAARYAADISPRGRPGSKGSPGRSQGGH